VTDKGLITFAASSFFTSFPAFLGRESDETFIGHSQTEFNFLLFRVA
jgi:hypothetical protein